MAETALSIARSVLGSAIGKAATAAAEEMSLLMGVQKDIWFMKDELKTMQAFLIAAEKMKKKKKPLLKVWAEQVRSLSYDIEDCLDEFMVHVGSQSLSQQLINLKDRHRIAVQIRNLKSRLEEVSSRNTRYNLIEMDGTNIDDTHSSLEDVRNHSASNMDKAELVGFDTPKQVMLGMINNQNSDGPVRVICVVGMGGLGKTTLVRKIYENKEDIVKDVSCFAWITISQSFSKIEMLKDMIAKFLGYDLLKKCLEKHDGKEMQLEDLASFLRDELREKRYFIVLDDLWNFGDWDWIRSISLPSDNNKDSLIIVTTRNADLAKMCTSELFIYHLEPLKEEHAIGLLLIKMRKRKEDMESDEKLKTFVKQLVKKCGYLPLAIVAIGALFATKKESEWDKLYTELPSELESNLSLEAIRNMVILSYDHLPSHLKSCFLYLSIFPEDFEIKRRCLVERWIAEGLVKTRVGMTLEEVGKRYFDELIGRSMIQPSRVNFEGIVKSCRVHDIMRDITVSLSREEGFVYTSGDNLTDLVEDNFRHVAYHVSKNCSMVGIGWGRLRSLTIFGERPIEHAPLLCPTKLKMIRVLDMENVDFEVAQKDISNIGMLRHLKYMNICGFKRDSSIYALPRSIGKLQGLQALKVRRSHISSLPTEICKLKRLRTLDIRSILWYKFFEPNEPVKCLMHSLCLPMIFTPLADFERRKDKIAELHMGYSSRWSRTGGVKVPRGIGNLKELHTLRFVDIKRTGKKAIKELGELSKLRKLSVSTEKATEKKCMTLRKAIQKLSSLASLEIDAGPGELEWADFVSSVPLLRSLNLRGRIGDKVDWFRNLTRLVKLRLSNSVLEEGKAVEILGSLPNLMHLYLGWESFAGKGFVLRQGAFLNLRKLYIIYPTQLREIRFKQGASPQMESIEIGGSKLKLGINGIKHLPNLKQIYLEFTCKVARLRMLQDEVNAHPNQPVLRLDRDRSFHDLGDPQESLPDHDGNYLEATTPTQQPAGQCCGASARS